MKGAVFTHRNVSFRLVDDRDLEILRTMRNDFTTWSQLTDPTLLTPERQLAWFRSISSRSEALYLVAFEEVIHFLGIVRMDEQDLGNRSVRVGADVLPELRGKGYGAAIYDAIKKYCFDYLNCHRIWLQVLETNGVALTLYRKTGFKEEGRLRQAVFRDGRYVDYIVMSILEGEYREMAP